MKNTAVNLWVFVGEKTRKWTIEKKNKKTNFLTNITSTQKNTKQKQKKHERDFLFLRFACPHVSLFECQLGVALRLLIGILRVDD